MSVRWRTILALPDSASLLTYLYKDSPMRSVFFAALLLPAAATVAQSQQAKPLISATEVTAYSQQSVVAHPTPAVSLRPVDAPIGITHAQALSKSPASNVMANSATAPVDNNTRNTLAIVGAVVIIIALLAFLL